MFLYQSLAALRCSFFGFEEVYTQATPAKLVIRDGFTVHLECSSVSPHPQILFPCISQIYYLKIQSIKYKSNFFVAHPGIVFHS